ncbi:hypothetical protein D3C76_1878010 [compost metagenome]
MQEVEENVLESEQKGSGGRLAVSCAGGHRNCVVGYLSAGLFAGIKLYRLESGRRLRGDALGGLG